MAGTSPAMTLDIKERSLGRDSLRRLGHGAIAHDAMYRLAIGVESRLGKLVAQI